MGPQRSDPKPGIGSDVTQLFTLEQRRCEADLCSRQSKQFGEVTFRRKAVVRSGGEHHRQRSIERCLMSFQRGHADGISGSTVPPANQHPAGPACGARWDRVGDKRREFRVLEGAKRAKFAIADGQSIVAANDAIGSLVQLDDAPIASRDENTRGELVEGSKSRRGSPAEIAQLDVQSARMAERLKQLRDLGGAGRSV